ncbi:hypothetical protein WN943_017849 [Citrus x changshan-huyou]
MRQLHERTGRSEEEDNLKKKKKDLATAEDEEDEDEDAAVADEWLVGICVCLKNIMHHCHTTLLFELQMTLNSNQRFRRFNYTTRLVIPAALTRHMLCLALEKLKEK